MYAVIFRATAAELDGEYADAIDRMKQLAFEEYGCREFIAMMDGDERIAISYWDSEEAIGNWKRNIEHAAAQQQGRAKWYRSYTVQVAEIHREYSHNR
jgi:heme-degrading monooxygenase HmoA